MNADESLCCDHPDDFFWPLTLFFCTSEPGCTSETFCTSSSSCSASPLPFSPLPFSPESTPCSRFAAVPPSCGSSSSISTPRSSLRRTAPTSSASSDGTAGPLTFLLAFDPVLVDVTTAFLSPPFCFLLRLARAEEGLFSKYCAIPPDTVTFFRAEPPSRGRTAGTSVSGADMGVFTRADFCGEVTRGFMTCGAEERGLGPELRGAGRATAVIPERGARRGTIFCTELGLCSFPVRSE